MHRLAWRNVWRNKIRSLVILFSVVLGMLAGIAVLAIYRGMILSRVRTVIDSETAHVQLHHPAFKKDFETKYFIPEMEVRLNELKKNKAIESVTPRSLAQGMLSTAMGTRGVMIYGVDPIRENKVSGLDKKIKEGTALSEKKRQGILIGKKLAEKLNLRPGNKVVLTFTDCSNNLIASSFRVSGIYESGNAPRDESMVFVNLNTLNGLLLMEDAAHELAILLTKDDLLDSVQQQLNKQFPYLLVESWKEISPETTLMVKTVDGYSYIIMMIILIAIAFGILNTMLMSVLERTHEIGMMLALGASRIRLFGLVFWETVYLTFAGVPFGISLAYWFTAYFQRNGLNILSMGKELMESFGYATIIYPVFPWDKITYIFWMVVLTALFSSLIPCVKALRLNPVDALRK